MRRGAQRTKPKVKGKPPPARKSLKNKGSKVRDLEKRLAEALEQQTATAEILRVISSSPTDLQPVFETIAQSAMRLCAARTAGVIYRVDETLHLVAHANVTPEWVEVARRGYPQPISRDRVGGLAILERRVVHVPDIHADDRFPHARRLAQAMGYRSVVFVPMLREDTAVGAVSLAGVEPFSDMQIALLQTFADQTVIAIENVRLFNETKEALEQQTATSEILGVISQSPTDVQPVFDTIAARAKRLCDALECAVFRFDGELIHLVAQADTDAAWANALRSAFPRPPGRGSITARAIQTRSLVHIPNVQADSEFDLTEAAQVSSIRSVLSVPMIREGEVIGAITVDRRDPKPFLDKQIALMETFADQAVIAIENVRLFTELQEKNLALTAAHAQVTEALEQQTATAEILRVISRSQTNVQPVFDTIVANAVRLCRAHIGAVFQFDGELLHLVAHHNFTPEMLAAVGRLHPRPPQRDMVSGRAILSRAVVQIEDILADREYHRSLAFATGWRSMIAVPMLREGQPIGTIVINRREPGPLTEQQIELLKTFADQAVIAIENVRLFTELQQKNEALTAAHAQVSESLEQQTATAEILHVISRSQTDVQPVFDTIVRSAVRLCDGLFSALYRFDGELIHPVAQHNFTREALEVLHRVYPTRPSRVGGTGRAILDRAVVHIPDVDLDPEFQHQAVSRAVGFRSGLFVPMLREGAPIGVIGVGRAEAGRFSDNEVELLKTFADQAVIAVENVRLFKELQARTGELTQSVEKLTALGEVSRAVSSTLDVETVLDTIVSRASQLAGAAGCSIYEYDEGTERFELRATHNADPEFVEALRAVPLRKGEGLMGRAAEVREPIQIPDITQPGAYESSVRDTLVRFGYRARVSRTLLS